MSMVWVPRIPPVALTCGFASMGAGHRLGSECRVEPACCADPAVPCPRLPRLPLSSRIRKGSGETPVNDQVKPRCQTSPEARHRACRSSRAPVMPLGCPCGARGIIGREGNGSDHLQWCRLWPSSQTDWRSANRGPAHGSRVRGCAGVRAALAVSDLAGASTLLSGRAWLALWWRSWALRAPARGVGSGRTPPSGEEGQHGTGRERRPPRGLVVVLLVVGLVALVALAVGVFYLATPADKIPRGCRGA
jgi:hypothetical protein